MSRIFTILGIATTLMVSRGQAQIKDVKINGITLQSNDGRSGENLLKVCYDNIVDLPVGILSRTLDMAVRKDVTGQFTDIRYLEFTPSSSEPNCIFFKGDISAYKGKEVWFILQGRDVSDAPLIHGEAIFLLPDIFYKTDDIISHWVGTRTKDETLDSLRLGTSSAGWAICDTSNDNKIVELHCTDDSKTPPCYAIETGSTGTYSLCTPEIDTEKIAGEAILFSATISPKESLIETKPVEIILEYGESDAKITMPASSITEFVPYIAKDKVYPIAINPIAGCPIADYDELKKTINIIIVKVDGETVTSNIISFEDYGINGVYLGEKIVEIYWQRAAADLYTFFGATIDSLPDLQPDTHTETVVIDCSLVDPEHLDPISCFGYFINLPFTTGKSYLINVAPDENTNEVYEPVLNNQIIHTIIHAKDSHTMLMGVKLQQDQSYPDGVLQVCFKAPEVIHNNTRHEAILIDEDGHWIKLYQSTKGQNMMQCFSPVDLFASSLRMKKDAKLTVVIVERDLRNLQVLASGQADIELSEFRVIKPETDSSSEGYMNTFTIVGAAIGGIACLMALVAATILFVMKRKKMNDGLQYPLHRNNLEDSNIIPGLDNPNSTI